LETTSTRWVIWLVIIAVIIAAILFALLLPVIYYGRTVWDSPNNEVALSLSTFTPTATSTQELVETNAQADLVTPTPTIHPDCTRRAIYWVYHPDNWPSQIITNNFSIDREEAIAFIQSLPVDISIHLMLEFIAANLNIHFGADPSVVLDDLFDAGMWLSIHPRGEGLLEADARQGFELAKRLEEFNSGVVGPGRCADDPSAYEGLPSHFPVPALSETPANVILTNVVTLTSSPAATATPTITATRPVVALPTATNTPKPSRNQNPNPTQRPPTREPRPTEPPPETDEPSPPEPPPPEPPP
jgi:hypothetical protein